MGGRIVHLLIDSNVAYNKDGSFGHTRCFIRDDTARKIRDARVQLLIYENERVRDDTNASFFCLILYNNSGVFNLTAILPSFYT